ncbi:hypothetical protein FACS1894191_5270 [Clostridia bacterium]|nr:hypothetical protein FACS1894191_5270 [Clostridia bacterium]
MSIPFPRTTVAGVSLSRMIIGTNWLAGWSHTSPAADRQIEETHHSPASITPLLEGCLENGVDTIMGPFDRIPHIHNAVLQTREKLGRNIIMVDTPIINVDDNAAARAEAAGTIRRSRELGATFCLLHHSAAEQLVNKNLRVISRLDDYTKMIRDEGMIPGLSAHMPEMIVYSDANGYDVETYIQIYNCLGFMMQVEIESVAKIISKAKKPVMTIKPMAAGRCTPFVGLNFSWATIRDCDMVTVGCLRRDEALEDIEISRAALEHRHPNIGARQSPNQNQAAFGNP